MTQSPWTGSQHFPGMDIVIIVTRLNGSAFALNPDLLERVDVTPDTVVTLVDGTKYVIAESLHQVVDLVRGYRASVVLAAQGLDPRAAMSMVSRTADDTKDAPIAAAVPMRPRRQ